MKDLHSQQIALYAIYCIFLTFKDFNRGNIDNLSFNNQISLDFKLSYINCISKGNFIISNLFIES